jgi:hypothetical protein
MPDPIPYNYMGKAILSEYNSDKKEWNREEKDYRTDRICILHSSRSIKRVVQE